MIKADVLITNRDWKKLIKTPHLYINKKLKKIDKKTKLFRNNSCNFTLLLSGDSEIKKLNIKFRKINKTTDILSFPFHEKFLLDELLKKKKPHVYLGDIIINLSKIGGSIKDKKFFLNFDIIWLHGLAHLLGHRHRLNRDFLLMKKLESKLIKFSK